MWTNFYGCVFKAQACLPLVGPRGAEDADRRLATSSSNGSARRLCLAACPLLLRERLPQKQKEQGLGCRRHPSGHPNGTWVFPFAPDICTIRVCTFSPG